MKSNSEYLQQLLEGNEEERASAALRLKRDPLNYAVSIMRAIASEENPAVLRSLVRSIGLMDRTSSRRYLSALALSLEPEFKAYACLDVMGLYRFRECRWVYLSLLNDTRQSVLYGAIRNLLHIGYVDTLVHEAINDFFVRAESVEDWRSERLGPADYYKGKTYCIEYIKSLLMD